MDLTSPRILLEYSCAKNHQGNCRIAIDIAGPSRSATQAITGIPNRMRGYAYWIIDTCVKNVGVGGFLSYGLTNMVYYLTQPTTNIYDVTTWGKIVKSILGDAASSNARYSALETSFFTITVDGGGADRRPGDNSPTVPGAIAREMANKYSLFDSNQAFYAAGAD